MKTILLVEDNPHIMNINVQTLLMYGYKVLQAESVTQCRNILCMHDVDLIILDVMLPDGNGIVLCNEIKQLYSIPILFLSALGDNEDVIAGLRAGGDDYLPKPYDLGVLLARVEARLRGNVIQHDSMSYEGIRLDLVAMNAYVWEQDLLLTQKEFLVLHMLLKNSHHPVDKETLYSEVWGVPLNEDSGALYTVVSRIKKKLTASNAGVTICYRKNKGYILEKE